MNLPPAARARSARRRRRAALVVMLALGLPLGCKVTTFLRPAPAPRGITLPVPPPSYTDDPVVVLDVDGTLGGMEDPDDTRVELFERSSERGYFTFSVGGEWVIQDVLVDLEDNCLEVNARDPLGDASEIQAFKLQISDPLSCETECYAPDQAGQCICVDYWNSGC